MGNRWKGRSRGEGGGWGGERAGGAGAAGCQAQGPMGARPAVWYCRRNSRRDSWRNNCNGRRPRGSSSDRSGWRGSRPARLLRGPWRRWRRLRRDESAGLGGLRGRGRRRSAAVATAAAAAAVPSGGAADPCGAALPATAAAGCCCCCCCGGGGRAAAPPPPEAPRWSARRPKRRGRRWASGRGAASWAALNSSQGAPELTSP